MGDIKDQLKNNDFGLAFGAGLHLPLGFNVGVRYILGFTDISDVSTESIKNRTFQVYVRLDNIWGEVKLIENIQV